MTTAFLSVLFFLAPIVTESARFNIYQNGQRIGSEDFTVSPRPGGGYFAEGRTQLLGVAAPLVSRMELDDQLNPTAYEFQQGGGTIRVKIEDPISEFERVAAGERTALDFRFPSGAFILDSNFFHHYLLLLYKVSSAPGTFSVFVPQHMQMGTATVRSRGNNVYEVETEDVKIEATTDAAGRLLRLTVPNAMVVVER